MAMTEYHATGKVATYIPRLNVLFVDNLLSWRNELTISCMKSVASF